jgi:ligand-binding sensor domain-containing protein/serine phosphatase RsbU (regulator of sigma subunit)
MIKNRKAYMKYLFILFAVFCQLLSYAQKPDLQFERITDKSGRTLGFVTGIAQDKHGFMWFSTRNGLYRYDGYNYKLFRSKSKDSTSLPFNAITSMYYDRQGTFWLKHLDKLAAFQNEKLSYQFQDITQKEFGNEVEIIEDKFQNIWIAPTKEGIYKYNRTSRRLDNITSPVACYNPKLFEIIDSLGKTKLQVEFLHSKTRKDFEKSVNIKESGDYLIVCIGASDNETTYDYGQVFKGGTEIWAMKPGKTRYAGGDLTNSVQAGIVHLEKGLYKGRYIFDRSQSETKNTPTKLDFYGLKIFKINNQIKSYLANLIAENYQSSLSISKAPILDLIVDNLGNFVYATSQGLTKYDNKQNTFKTQPINFAEILGVTGPNDFQVNTIYQDKKGFYWVGTSLGLIRTNGASVKVFRNNTPKDSILSSNNVYCVFEDFEGNIWVGTENGLNLYDPHFNLFYKYKTDNINRLYSNEIIQIFEDKSSNLWIATQEGLNKLKKSKFRFFKLQMDGYASFPMVNDNGTDLWYHGKQNTLFHYDRSANTYEKFDLNPSFFISDSETSQKTYIFNDILNSGNEFYLAIHDGVYVFDKIKKKITETYKLPEIKWPGGKRIENILAIRKGVMQNLFIFSSQGIYNLNLYTKKITDFLSFGNVPTSEFDIDLQFIKHVFKDKNGNYWVRTSTGVQLFTPITFKLTKIIDFDETIRFTSASEGNISEDKKGDIWIAAMPKLYKVDGTTKKTSVFVFEEKIEVGRSKTTEDVDGNVWIYTDNGLFRFNKSNTEFKQFTNKDGLADNLIVGLVDDNNGNLWICSTKGITRFAKRNEQFTIVSTDFISNNFVDIDVSTREKNGEVLFYTTEGFYRFKPEKINRSIAPVVLTRFALFGNEYEFDSLIYQKHEIVLNYTQNNLSFEFSALDYTDPAENQFATMLENLEENWTFRDANDRRATYSALQPGTYILHIKGTNNDFIWNEKGLSVRVIITPPFYKRPWFIACEVLLGILLIILIIKWRERNLIKEKKILEEKVVERTAEIEVQKKEIEKQRDIATIQRDQIAQQKKEITDSIMYASRIQTAILPPEPWIEKLLPDHFILYKPRDIVSGDFYWMTQQDEKVFFAAADCTGHGVPGAFMSMLGIAFLNEILNKREAASANQVLNALKAHVIKSLHQTGKENESKDGMDISLCVIDLANKRVEFSGAYNSLILIRKGEMLEYKADRMPIGIYFKDQDSFTNHQIDYQEGDTLYMHSDGYPDQFGGENGRKFMMKQFKQLLLEIQGKTMAEQRNILDRTMLKWRGETDQIDDILVVGIKL